MSTVMADTIDRENAWNMPAHDDETTQAAEGLAAIARRTAEELFGKASFRGSARGLRRFHQNHRFLRSAYREFSSQEDARKDSRAEYILDNFSLLEARLRTLPERLPGPFYGELPRLKNGLPRIFVLSKILLDHTNNEVDEDSLTQFVSAYQEVEPLTMSELWAMPTILEMALLENLCPLISDIRYEANCKGMAEKILKQWYVQSARTLVPRQILHRLSPNDDRKHSTLRAVSPLVARLLQATASDGLQRAAFLRRLERDLEEHHLRLDDVLEAYHHDESESAASVRKIVESFRLIREHEWTPFFERTSVVDDVLRQDPVRVYQAMDVETRDRYRHAVQELSKRSKISEVDIARRAIELAARRISQADDPRVRHVGFFLVDKGRDELEASIHYRPTQRDNVSRFVLHHSAAVYFGSIGYLTALGMGAFWMIAALAGGSAAMCLIASLLGIWPASEFAVQIVNHFTTTWFPPRTLPKLEFKEEIPSHCATMVVVPSLLLHEREVATLLERLELHYLANSDTNLYFALLTDFSDAPRPHLTTDDALLQQAIQGIRKLNDRYRSVEGSDDTQRGPAANRFYLFHRARQWNALENVWMGWERKRGKLLEFNRLLLGADDTSYVVHEGKNGSLPPIKFVITLDADTQLPHGAARRLIGTLAHPLNRPQFREDAHGKCVSIGYSMLQPRVSVSLLSANRSWYSRIFSTGAGLDPYITAVSDVYQDLFGEGIFVGKGIYDVEAFQRSTGDAFPENHILSHDLIEGCHARVGLVTDIALVDGFPTRYDADVRRQHRWIRGDWQLLPWLFNQPLADRSHKFERLSPISRWKVFDNLRRSLLAPALLVLIILGWTILPGSPWVWTLLALIVPALPLSMDLTRAIRNRPNPVGVRDAIRASSHQLIRAFSQAALTVLFLPHRAYSALDAIVRSQFRMWVTRRNLLEWECAAATEQRLNGRRGMATLREMWFAPFLGGSLLILMAAGVITRLQPAMPFAVAWCFSPLIAEWISRPIHSPEPVLSFSQRKSLSQLARRTWSYFEAIVGPEGNWLPADNLQEHPTRKIVHRLSPTNEGLFLVSLLAAHDLDFVSLERLADVMEANLDSLESLERHRGHFYNWYDSTRLRSLTPRYVSTVDSGNLVACLITVQQGLIDLANQHVGPLHDRLQRLADRCRRIVDETDFSFLFDPQRRLFHIGFNLERNELDRSHYDLLASEARLASFVAIAKGDVDHRHWFQLGRRLTRVGQHQCLLSWGAGLFEYLMPLLFDQNVPDSLLDETCRAALSRQIEYGQQRRVPWGISESSFAALNADRDYCYQSFGVPGLGLKRGLAANLVVAPYATALALLVDPVAAVRNFRRLARAGALGEYGFFDAIDYTPERLSRRQNSVVVRCYMTHHQGMSMTALVNCLQEGIMQQRFHSHPAIRAAELLFQERVPEEVLLASSSSTAEDELPLQSASDLQRRKSASSENVGDPNSESAISHVGQTL